MTQIFRTDKDITAFILGVLTQEELEDTENDIGTVEIRIFEQEACGAGSRLDLTIRQEDNLANAIISAYDYGMARGVLLAKKREERRAAE